MRQKFHGRRQGLQLWFHVLLNKSSTLNAASTWLIVVVALAASLGEQPWNALAGTFSQIEASSMRAVASCWTLSISRMLECAFVADAQWYFLPPVTPKYWRLLGVYPALLASNRSVSWRFAYDAASSVGCPHLELGEQHLLPVLLPDQLGAPVDVETSGSLPCQGVRSPSPCSARRPRGRGTRRGPPSRPRPGSGGAP